MLTNTKALSTKESKEVEKLIKTYQDLQAQITDLETSKKEVLEKIFKLANEGKNETQNYIFTKAFCNGRITVNIKELEKNHISLYNALNEKNLFNIGKDYWRLTGIKKKTEI